jgi:hypothetical protein
MSRITVYTAGVLLSSLLLSACSWVRVTPEGRDVRLLTQSQVTACQRVGTTTSTTTSRVVVVPRGSETVQTELVDLARNEAGLMGGNAIVADGTVVDGRQRFIVYDCP